MHPLNQQTPIDISPVKKRTEKFKLLLDDATKTPHYLDDVNDLEKTNAKNFSPSQFSKGEATPKQEVHFQSAGFDCELMV